MQAHAAGDPLERALSLAHHVLPDQGPIGVFIHHNTLHAFQARPFHEGVQRGAALLGAAPYLTLEQFRAAIAAGRIEEADLEVEVELALREASQPGDVEVLPGLTRRVLWRRLLEVDTETDDAPGLRYLLAGDPALQARVRALRARLAPRPGEPRALRRHRDALVALGAGDTDEVLHPELVRLSAAFLDQGHAHARFPGREHGFLGAVARAVAAGGSLPRECRGARADLRAVAERAAKAIDPPPEGLRPPGSPALEVVRAQLAALGVEGEEVEPFTLGTLLALPGWGGMFSRLERHPVEMHEPVPVALLDLLAVRLILERHAVEGACAARGLPVAWGALRARVPAPPARDPLLDAWAIARVWPGDASVIDDAALERARQEMLAFGPLRRRALLLEAYERRYRRQVLDGLAARRRAGPFQLPGRPAAQFIFCIDEREESMRRAIDEQGPHLQSFAAAGFFGVAMDYRGLDDHAPAAYCPVVVTPGHEVHELHEASHSHGHALRNRLRAAWHGLERGVARASRSLVGGAGLSVLFGPLAGALTTSRVMAPRATLLARDGLADAMAQRPRTRLSSFREEDARGTTGKPLGFSLDEAAARTQSMLENLGLVRPELLAPIVLVLGHGSTSLNNPHESAHDCGACGGRRGGANARLFAELINRPDVRAALKGKGLVVPDDTWFVGGVHDTADDSVRLADLELVPDARRPDLERALAALEVARRHDARERCRRFDDAPLGLDPEDALVHVEARSSHLGQPRPEYGHCTNAVAVVGRPALTRGLFLDRRAFLVGYDPTVDPQGRIVERILAAVGPVGAGISLEYYFSSVDNEVFGCGTKLPHNVTGLIGIMNGHSSDLRTGLPLQMVELHEPMRLLLIVEATPETLLAVAGRQAEVRELVVNRWVQLVSLHPETGAMAWFGRGGTFEPYTPSLAPLPAVESSFEWFGRRREHLPPALVRAGMAAR